MQLSTSGQMVFRRYESIWKRVYSVNWWITNLATTYRFQPDQRGLTVRTLDRILKCTDGNIVEKSVVIVVVPGQIRRIATGAPIIPRATVHGSHRRSVSKWSQEFKSSRTLKSINKSRIEWHLFSLQIYKQHPSQLIDAIQWPGWSWQRSLMIIKTTVE